jgi:hypothetical protein
MSAPEITRMLLTDESHVCKVIHDFNRTGSSRCALVSGAGGPPGSRLTTKPERPH